MIGDPKRNRTRITGMASDTHYHCATATGRCHSDLGIPVFWVSPCFGYPRVLGTPVPKSLVFWVPKTLKA